jgi:MFS family permease
MKVTSRRILRTYVTLTLLSTFASSFIWGINTLFLLDAGLSITEAFAANAFFTVGQVLFEVPTGVLADTVGRRFSYLLGSATLFASTALYWWLWVISAPFWMWAIASLLIGLGFTFFSGATEAWLVDALKFTKYKGSLENAFAKGQVASGIAMLSGTVIGAYVAQMTNLGVPYIIRGGVLLVTLYITYRLMHDLGFKPRKGASIASEMSYVVKTSVDHGIRNRPVRWMMLSGPFTFGVGIYAFYALQPYLLELYGRPDSYFIVGVGVALISATQILGGVLVPYCRKAFRYRTGLLAFAVLLSTVALILIGLVPSFWLTLIVIAIWSTTYAITVPVRQAYINDLIPSAQRATVVSSDNLIGNAGGVVIQPGLGKVADMHTYAWSYIGAGAIQLIGLPFIMLARKQRASSDSIETKG